MAKSRHLVQKFGKPPQRLTVFSSCTDKSHNTKVSRTARSPRLPRRLLSNTSQAHLGPQHLSLSCHPQLEEQFCVLAWLAHCWVSHRRPDRARRCSLSLWKGETTQHPGAATFPWFQDKQRRLPKPLPIHALWRLSFCSQLCLHSGTAVIPSPSSPSPARAHTPRGQHQVLPADTWTLLSTFAFCPARAPLARLQFSGLASHLWPPARLLGHPGILVRGTGWLRDSDYLARLWVELPWSFRQRPALWDWLLPAAYPAPQPHGPSLWKEVGQFKEK